MKNKLVIVMLMLLLLISGSCATVQALLSKVVPATQELDEETIIAGLKEALAVGTKAAVNIVSAKDGYFTNSAIKIVVPEDMQDVEKKLRQIGLGDKVDEFIRTMNQAAEKAATEAVNIFTEAVKQMTLEDARRILQGADNAATRYFEDKTRDKLYKNFDPVIKNAMEKVGVIKIFKFLMDNYNKIPLVKKININITDYVNNKALDGLFLMLAGEEKKIRHDPAARVTELLKKVFGN